MTEGPGSASNFTLGFKWTLGVAISSSPSSCGMLPRGGGIVLRGLAKLDRRSCLRNWFSQESLDGGEFPLFFLADKGNGRSLCGSAGCSTYPVHVILSVMGNIVI